MKSDRKRTILFVIILLILSMGIGYAFLTTTLTIDGVSNIDSAVWDIHWENVQVQSESVSGSKVISPATIGNNGTSVSYHVKLEPGDFYEFTVDAVNDGTMDAIIDDISITINDEESELPSYLYMEMVYDDIYIPISVGNRLPAGTTCSYEFYVYYKSNLTIDELPQSDQSLTISYNITYVQYKQPFYNNTYLYTSDEVPSIIGQELNDYSIYYDNYQDALNAFGHHTFLRHYIVNNIISTSEVGFEINGRIFYVQGGTGGSSYSSNTSVKQDMLNECNNSPEVCDNIYLSILENDAVYFSHNYHYRCNVWENGYSRCWYYPGA